MIILDNFLPSYGLLKDYSLTCKFEDEVNPVDGVVYPHICKVLPEQVKTDLIDGLSLFMHRPIKNPIMFLRMSPEGVACPHIYHNDSSMGDFSFMLYLDARQGGGTGFYRHIESGAVTPREDILPTLIKDCNNHSKWELVKMADMVENRGVIFNSELFHAALPFGGYGKSQEDSRIVCTVFFS